jgi:hypothetical protein
MKITKIGVSNTSLLLMMIFSIVSLINKETTVFYMIYLFWFDELIKTIFSHINRLKARYKNTTTQDNSIIVHSLGPFFMLGIYVVFIIVIFGFMMGFNQSETAIINFTVLFFQNTFFNFTLLTFIARELYFLFVDNKVPAPPSFLSYGMITLHISIILGTFIWFATTIKFQYFEKFADVLSIIPFLLLKFLFELKRSKKN